MCSLASRIVMNQGVWRRRSVIENTTCRPLLLFCPHLLNPPGRCFVTSPSTPHDVGGDTSAFGPIPAGDENLLAWEQQCHSLFVVLASKKVLSTDQLRRSIEDLTADQYKSWTYYEKWSAGMTSLLLESNTITHDELSSALFGGNTSGDEDENGSASGVYQESSSQRFQVGDAVRVKPFQSGVEWRRPHIRTPGYIYGAHGFVERCCGRHKDPSFLAFGMEAPSQQLYRVRFRMCDLWPEQHPTTESNDEDDDNNGNGDVVEVELYEHWLEPTEKPVGHAYAGMDIFNHQDGNDCVNHHAHAQHHHHSHEDHVHEARSLVEQRAVDREGPARPGKQLHQSLMKILLQKKIVTANDVRLASERLDTAGKRLDGASLVVRAWKDPSFHEFLLSDAPAAASTMGISTSNPNAPTVLTVVPNTEIIHNLIVCTLCSCYPSGLLGIAPSWYKSREYRSRAVREPRRVLEQEFGLHISKKRTIRVHDSTADHRYLVLPMRPAGTEGFSDEELRALVTRDTMIGVAEPTLHTAGS